MTLAPRTRTSPSSATLTSTPGSGGPTVPSRMAPGRFRLTTGEGSVSPYPSSTGSPRGGKKGPAPGGEGSPPREEEADPPAQGGRAAGADQPVRYRRLQPGGEG